MILRLALLQTKSICFSQVRFLSIVIPRCFCELTDSMVCSCIETAMLLLSEVVCFEPATNACVTNGLSDPYLLDESTFSLRGYRSIY